MKITIKKAARTAKAAPAAKAANVTVRTTMVRGISDIPFAPKAYINSPRSVKATNVGTTGAEAVLPRGKRTRRPTHPGAILREMVVPATGLSQGQIADVLGVSRRTVNELLTEKRAVSTDMAYRLAAAFGSTPEYWLRLQMSVDLHDAAVNAAETYQQIRRVRDSVEVEAE